MQKPNKDGLKKRSGGARNADPSKLKQPEPGDRVSLRQFAALVGVDYISAREALENGRIQYEPGTKEIDFFAQRAAYEETRAEPLGVEAEEDLGNLTPLGRAKYRKENASAQLKEIELARAREYYLDKESVQNAVFKWSRTVRDALLVIPERVASELAAQLHAMYKDKPPSESAVERVVRATWEKESRAVLIALTKKPTIKNKVSNAETA